MKRIESSLFRRRRLKLWCQLVTLLRLPKHFHGGCGYASQTVRLWKVQYRGLFKLSHLMTVLTSPGRREREQATTSYFHGGGCGIVRGRECVNDTSHFHGGGCGIVRGRQFVNDTSHFHGGG
ncbi:hypothetical protein QAD02_005611 [Eretmocerus hayati]|uniref:Uncharacterized protein n=1 Tax=Eretmocerus hayati TaxID=131215 RepID=A0ACC2NSW7_9HYME|nr:hypothetical protein QAD02_005611 [Eretmocerus hayati]